MSNNAKGPTIAIDGPAGSGKSTISKLLARHFSFKLVDTGAIYRSLALAARQKGLTAVESPELSALASKIEVDFAWDGEINRVFLNGLDVSEAIRTEEISAASSQFAALPVVRAALLNRQRDLAAKGSVVLEGRDIGTVVYPQAEFKFFLEASPEVRAERRIKELAAKGLPTDNVLADIIARDKRDRERPIAPLKAADDAIVIDTSNMDIATVLHQMIGHITINMGA